jgi:hypothetical protein
MLTLVLVRATCAILLGGAGPPKRGDPVLSPAPAPPPRASTRASVSSNQQQFEMRADAVRDIASAARAAGQVLEARSHLVRGSCEDYPDDLGC